MAPGRKPVRLADMSSRSAKKDIVRRLRAEVVRALTTAGAQPGDRMIIGCSHGPDSLTLADAVLASRPALGLRGVTLVYVDHGLRATSPAEGEAVHAFAAAHGASAVVVAVNVCRHGTGLEDAARVARYAALETAAKECSARWIALGHTASDQAETVFMRLLRGAGVVGLAGIPPVRGPYVRPLLGLYRPSIEAYVQARGLAPSNDASNDDLSLLRNRVRHQHLPALRRENPSFDDALARAALALREQADALDWAARCALEQVGDFVSGTEVRLCARDLAALPGGVAKRLLFRVAVDLGASLEGRHLETLLSAAQRPDAGSDACWPLPGLSAQREYGDLVLRAAGAPPPLPAALPPALRDPSAFHVRPWEPGDRMRPARLNGRSRKLQDLYTDKKIPVIQRRAARVVVRRADGAIVWAEHIGPALDIDLEL